MSDPRQPYEYPRENSFSPVDPYTPGNNPGYPPSYPPPQPQSPGYGYPTPYQGAPPEPGAGYPGPYDPYQPYQPGYPGYPAPSTGTNGLAIASLITSIAGVVIGLPLAIFCWIGVFIPIIGTVLGIVALNQVNRTKQPGRGMAIAGIAIGGVAIALAVAAIVIAFAVLARSYHTSS
jgi:hypothetical protein